MAEDKLRKLAKRYESSGRLEVQWADKALAQQARNTRKALVTLCKQYNGHREYHVRVRLCTGTWFTDVQPTADPEVFTGRMYPILAMGNVPSGITGTFRFTRIAQVDIRRKSSAITRR